MTDKYIELHLHLDGSITSDIARKLAMLQNISVPDRDCDLDKLLTVPSNCTSLNDFLKCFEFPLTLLQTSDGISEAVYLVAENIRAQNVIYAEIRFAPQLHTLKGLSQEDAIKAAITGIKKSTLRTNLILCCMRGDDNDDENMMTLNLARKYLVEDGGVVAIDLAGAEALFPTSKYSSLFEKAREYGVPFTIHAGEADGPDSIRLAMEYGARRIGHGVRLFEDDSLLNEVNTRGLFLEMCPTSNRQTHAIEDMSNYPLIDYLNKGVKVTVNTDDMAIEGTNLKTEFEYIKEKFGLTTEQKGQILKNAVDAAFTTYDVKMSLLRELDL